MTWSYTISDLATSTKDQIRLMIGDILSTEPQLQDEEINFFIGRRTSMYGAAAECCRSLQARFSRSVDQANGTYKTMYSQMAKAYGVKANEFEALAAAAGSGLPYAGGISVADKLEQQADPDRVQPQFQIGMEDNLLPVPAAGNLSSVPGSGG